MKQTAFFVFSLSFIGLLVLLNLVINRWKFEWKGFSLLIGYGLATGLPVAYAVMFAGEIDYLAYGALASLIAGPFVVLETLNLIKGRGSPFRSAAGIGGIISMMSSPFFDEAHLWIPIAAGIAGLASYIAFHFRYPALNPMWLAAQFRSAASAVPRGCGYTPKPITVFGKNGATFFGGAFGCGVYVRRDRTIVWMKRSLHERLGRPNLELLALEIAKRIKEKGKG